MVFVSAAGVAVTVSTTVVAADPASTLTTEYVSRRANGSIQGDPWRKKGRDEAKQKSDDTAKSAGVEVLRRMVTEGESARNTRGGLRMRMRERGGELELVIRMRTKERAREEGFSST